MAPVHSARCEATLSTPHTSAQLGYLCCLFAHLNASFRRRCGYLYPFGDVAAISTYSRPTHLGDISARWRQTRLARPPRRSGEADSPPRKETERGRRKTWRRRRRTGSRLEKKSRVAEERHGRARRGASPPAWKKKAHAQTEMTGRGGGTRRGRLSAQQRHLGNLGVISGNLAPLRPAAPSPSHDPPTRQEKK